MVETVPWPSFWIWSNRKCHTRKDFRRRPKPIYKPLFQLSFNGRIFWSCNFHKLLLQIYKARCRYYRYNNLVIHFETISLVIIWCIFFNLLVNYVLECIIFKTSSIVFSQITFDIIIYYYCNYYYYYYYYYYIVIAIIIIIIKPKMNYLNLNKNTYVNM